MTKVNLRLTDKVTGGIMYIITFIKDSKIYSYKMPARNLAQAYAVAQVLAKGAKVTVMAL